MLKRLQLKLEQERNQEKRDDIELQIVVVLGIINMQKGLNEVKASIAKMQKQ